MGAIFHVDVLVKMVGFDNKIILQVSNKTKMKVDRFVLIKTESSYHVSLAPSSYGVKSILNARSVNHLLWVMR